MKRTPRFTLSRVMHNNKAMMVVSLLAALAVWMSVTLGPTTVKSRTFTVPVNLRIENPNFIPDLRILDHDQPVMVTVKVEGPLSVVSRLTESAFSITPDYSDITGEGKRKVTFSVSKSGVEQSYEFVEILPRSIDVSCVLWNSGRELLLEIDADAVAVADEVRGNHEIGEPRFVSAALGEDNRVTVEGPQSVVNKIQRLVARVAPSSLLAEAELPADIVALDAEDNELSLDRCTVTKVEALQTPVRVPLAFTKKVSLQYTVLNLPPAQETRRDFVTLSPAEVFLVGREDAVEAYAALIENLPPVDIGTVSETDRTLVHTLPRLLDGVTMPAQDDQVTYRFATEGYRGRDMTFTAEGGESAQIEFINAAPGTKASILKIELPVHLVGPTDGTLRAVTAKTLKLTVDLAERTWGGECNARVTVMNRRDVWVYGEFRVFVDVTAD